MDFEELVQVYEQLEKISSGNEIREILADFFKKVSKDDLKIVTYLTLGRISPEYDSVVLGMADKSVLKALASASGIEIGKVNKLMQDLGDVGLAAEKVLQKKPRTLVPVGRLTIHELFEKLEKISQVTGTGSQDQKSNILISLLQKTSSLGAKYVCRIVLGTLRMGVAEMTVLDSLAIAFTGDKQNKEVLEQAYNLCPDVGEIAEIIGKKGLKGMEKVEIKVGRPIKMMLAQRVQELEEVSEKISGELTVEAKYDGERIQAHKNSKEKITLFSRRLENITDQFPDLVEHLQQGIKAKEFILEGEVLAIDAEGNHLPFQTLMQRRRKYDVEEYIKKIPVRLKCFDLLYLNGKSVMNENYLQRSEELSKIVQKGKNLTLTEKIITDDIEEVNDFFQKMLKEKFEGVIIKSHQGEYLAGSRGWNWIKWKKDYVQEMTDTLDLVIVGAYFGKGRRSGSYGALLCACYDSVKDEFLTVCKLGTGLTDEMLEELPKKLNKYKLAKNSARVVVKREMEPDVWFTPELVVEVLGAEITKSPFHTAGLALRFPRFVRLRDKKAEQATTKKELESMGN